MPIIWHDDTHEPLVSLKPALLLSAAVLMFAIAVLIICGWVLWGLL